MFELNGVKLSEEELATMIDSYLGSRHYVMWARWDIAKAGPSREDARQWFMDQIQNLTEFLPVKADKPGDKPWMQRRIYDRETDPGHNSGYPKLVAVGD